MRKERLLALSLCGILLLSACGGGSMLGRPGAPAVTLSANSLSFPDEVPGSTSAPETVIVRNSGTAALGVTAIGVFPEYSQKSQ